MLRTRRLGVSYRGWPLQAYGRSQGRPRAILDELVTCSAGVVRRVGKGQTQFVARDRQPLTRASDRVIAARTGARSQELIFAAQPDSALAAPGAGQPTRLSGPRPDITWGDRPARTGAAPGHGRDWRRSGFRSIRAMHPAIARSKVKSASIHSLARAIDHLRLGAASNYGPIVPQHLQCAAGCISYRDTQKRHRAGSHEEGMHFTKEAGAVNDHHGPRSASP